MAKRSKTAQEAYDIAKPEAEKMGFDLVDAEYKKEGQGMFLRLFIDKKGGISRLSYFILNCFCISSAHGR